MFAAADALDEGADPAAYRRAFEAVLAYGRTLYPADHPELAWLEAELATFARLRPQVEPGQPQPANGEILKDMACGEDAQAPP
ncbi:MAG: hypothetical protein ACK414_14495, partial [Gemmobacter sp.]